MTYLEVLSKCHDLFNPQRYVEIGVRMGRSFNLARCRSIGIDPDYDENISVGPNATLYKYTSDEFFDTFDLSELLGGNFDVAFIDGMHLAEYALRDFMNLESHAHPGSIIIIDDILPDQIEWTSRERKTKAWTGDVYKLIRILARYRPDLEIDIFKVDIKGVAIISCLNKFSNILQDKYDEIVRDIENGVYQISSIPELHNVLSPLPASAIDGFLNECRLQISRRKYLSLLKDALINNIYADYDLRVIYINEFLAGEREYNKSEFLNITTTLSKEYKELLAQKIEGRFYHRKIPNAGFAHSMIGAKRMHALISTLDIVRINDIPGELVECGVWRGGSSIMMAAYNETYGLKKKVYVADSFYGLPKPGIDQDAKLDLSKEKYPELAIPLEVVRENFRKYNLLTNNIYFVEGWFKDTLPTLKHNIQISLLRLDGDLYESTRDILINLYDDVVSGGVIYIDDWGIKNCREAVFDFLAARDLAMPDFVTIDWTGIYWIKK